MNLDEFFPNPKNRFSLVFPHRLVALQFLLSTRCNREFYAYLIGKNNLLQPQFHVHQSRITGYNMLKKGLSALSEDRAIRHLPVSREERVNDFFSDVVQVQTIEGRRELPNIAIVHKITIEYSAMAVGIGKERIICACLFVCQHWFIGVARIWRNRLQTRHKWESPLCQLTRCCHVALIHYAV